MNGNDTILFSCPRCHKKLRVGAKSGCKRVRCPNKSCRAKLLIPKRDRERLPQSKTTTDGAVSNDERTVNSNTSDLNALLGCLGCLLLLALSAIGIVGVIYMEGQTRVRAIGLLFVLGGLFGLGSPFFERNSLVRLRNSMILCPIGFAFVVGGIFAIVAGEMPIWFTNYLEYLQKEFIKGVHPES